MVYGYVQISIDKQGVESQRLAIQGFANENGMPVGKWIEERISPSQRIEQRALGKMIKKIRKGDVFIASESYRLGRSLQQLAEAVAAIMSRGAKLYSARDGHGMIGGAFNSSYLAICLAISAEIDRSIKAQNTREALLRAKAEGRAVGRPLGRRNARSKLAGREAEARRLLASGMGKAAAAKRLGVHRDTLAAFVRGDGRWAGFCEFR